MIYRNILMINKTLDDNKYNFINDLLILFRAYNKKIQTIGYVFSNKTSIRDINRTI